LSIDVIKSKVGREIFALSSLIAAVPILVVGALSLLQVNRTFDERTRDYLGETVRAYGLVVYERLLLASELVYQTSATSGDAVSEASEQLAAVTLVDKDGALSNDAMDLSPELIEAALQVTGPTLVVSATASAADIFILRKVGDRTAVGLVAPGYLWGESTDNPYSVNFCIVASGINPPVHCSQPIPDQTRRAIQDAPAASGTLSWEADGERMTSSYWELFTRSTFNAPLLRFIATQPEAVALEPWNAFKALYAPALLLTIGIVLFASSFHVRRILGPLHALLSVTRRFIKGDFTARADTGRRDEFADVADAMNSMADGLSKQFDALKMLSGIDQLILSGAKIEQVVELIVKQVGAIIPCECVGVVLIDRESPVVAISQCTVRGEPSVGVERLALEEGAYEWIRPHSKGIQISDLSYSAICGPLMKHGVERAFLIPLLARDRVAGALILGYRESFPLDDVQLRYVRDFADRLAVALEAAERESELLRRAYFDELTKLPNRQLFLDRLQQALIQARQGSYPLAILFVDIDRFKTVNDSLGHAAGDYLLREAAARLCGCVAEAVTVARLGGDEFVVLIPQPGGTEGRAVVIDKLLRELSKPFRVGSSEVFLSASIGVATFPDDGETAEELLRKADTAMYGAKEAGRGQALYYSVDMGRKARERLEIEAQLRHALEREEFRLVYQPQVCLRSNRRVAAEALLRWLHPDRGLLNPVDFIPVAEESGYISILGAWVMHKACTQLKQWRQVGGQIERVAVNVSARQFHQVDFIAQVEDCLARVELPPESLELELTESVFVHDFQSARKVIDGLKALGVSIAIDDFGTGYSSLGYLKHLSFDLVKIDYSFIKDLPDDRDGSAIVNAVVAMAHTLGKLVMAEGIETRRQLKHLQEVGVDLGQGFLLGKPVSPEEFLSRSERLDPRVQPQTHHGASATER